MTWLRARHEGISYDKIHGDSSYRFLRIPVPGTLHTGSAALLSTVEGAGSIYGPLYVQEETVPDVTHLPEDKGCHIGCNEAILGAMALPSCGVSEPLEPWLRCQSTRGGRSRGSWSVADVLGCRWTHRCAVLQSKGQIDFVSRESQTQKWNGMNGHTRYQALTAISTWLVSRDDAFN